MPTWLPRAWLARAAALVVVSLPAVLLAAAIRASAVDTFLLACLVFVNVLVLAGRTLAAPGRVRLATAFLAAVLIFSPVQHENWLLGIQLVYFVPINVASDRACLVANEHPDVGLLRLRANQLDELGFLRPRSRSPAIRRPLVGRTRRFLRAPERRAGYSPRGKLPAEPRAR